LMNIFIVYAKIYTIFTPIKTIKIHLLRAGYTFGD